MNLVCRHALYANVVGNILIKMTASNTKDEKWFWDIIDQSRGTKKKINHERQIKNLTKILSSLTADEILQFDKRFHLLLKQSYTWDLWGAAFIINGGCSDDTFDYFRSWLIGQGEQAFYNAVANPETLKDILKPKEEYEWEGLEYSAPEAYEKATGKEMEVVDSTEEAIEEHEPVGKKWNENELPDLFPKLWKSFSKHVNYGGSKIQPKKIDPTTIGATFKTSEIPKPSFWLNELSKRGHDVVLRMIGELESNLENVSQTDYSGYLIQLKSRLTKEPMGILIKEMKFNNGAFDLDFQLYDKKLAAMFIDIGLILSERNEVTIKTGNVEFSSSEWKTYVETGVLMK
jgi:hypothetical protein